MIRLIATLQSCRKGVVSYGMEEKRHMGPKGRTACEQVGEWGRPTREDSLRRGTCQGGRGDVERLIISRVPACVYKRW